MRLSLLLLVFPWTICGIGFDNEIVEPPSIQCTEESITFSVRTRNAFRGKIYVKGQHNIPNCKLELQTNDYSGATFTIPLGQCGMRKNRQAQPYGMNYIIPIVTSFHPRFVTKMDRSYNVRCFYAFADQSVQQEMGISDKPPESLEQATMIMPSCTYSVRKGSVDGPKVEYVYVGEQIVHVFECDNNVNFGMLVKNCVVRDGNGETSETVLDNRGCPVQTATIQGELTYDPTRNLAFVAVSAYKFPDKPSLYFQCQIQVCNKREGECMGVTPPNCPAFGPREFSPNSILRPEMSPTQVIATFENRPDMLHPLIVPPGPLAPADSFRDRFLGYPFERRKEETPEVDEEADDDSKHEDKEERRRNFTAMGLSTSTSTANPITQPNTPENVPKLRVFRSSPPRIREEILDVQTDVNVIDKPENCQSEDECERSFPEGILKRDSQTQLSHSSEFPPTPSLTCFHSNVVYAVGAVLVITITLSLFIFLFRNCIRSFWGNSEGLDPERVPSRSTTTSTVSSVYCDSMDGHRPVFSRKLGNPNYIVSH